MRRSRKAGPARAGELDRPVDRASVGGSSASAVTRSGRPRCSLKLSQTLQGGNAILRPAPKIMCLTGHLAPWVVSSERLWVSVWTSAGGLADKRPKPRRDGCLHGWGKMGRNGPAPSRGTASRGKGESFGWHPHNALGPSRRLGGRAIPRPAALRKGLAQAAVIA
ncbi:hypothetical protein D516_1841 [Rhodobacter sp. AKP1]|nr:hypothetical protein D516_1841 [Rhodobacter sp. AKP1]